VWLAWLIVVGDSCWFFTYTFLPLALLYIDDAAFGNIYACNVRLFQGTRERLSFLSAASSRA